MTCIIRSVAIRDTFERVLSVSKHTQIRFEKDSRFFALVVL